jgi:flagellar M-ring protein FliF
MKEQILAALHKVWNEFKSFSPGQKAITTVAALALLVGGIVFATWKSSPPYAPLYTNLAASDASAIVDKLNSGGIPYKLTQAGSEIEVPQSKVYATRLTMSAAGLPSSSQTGYSLLDKEGVTTSQFKQQVDYQRAIEGELDQTIESMSGVQNASVHLAIPQQDVFNDGSQKTTAAVLLTMAPGTQLTTAQVQSVVYLISSSVPDLSSNDVTVTDSNGQLLAAPGDAISGTAGTDTQSQATQDFEEQQAAKLQALVTPIVGVGHAVVTVNAALDFDKTNTTDSTYVYTPSTPPLSEQTTDEKYNGNGAATGGTLGAGSPSATASGSAGNGSYEKKSDTIDNAVGTKTQTVQSAPGSVSKLSVAVLLDSSVKNINVAQIKSLINSAAGLTPARGDSLSIQAMPFDTSAAKAAAQSASAAAKAAAAAKSHAQLMSLVKQGALGGLVVALVVGTWLASRKRRKQGNEPLNDDLFGLDPVTPDLAPPALPEPSIPDEVLEAAARRRALVAIADEQPKDIAAVLSGWLSSKDTDLNNNTARNPWATTSSGGSR